MVCNFGFHLIIDTPDSHLFSKFYACIRQYLSMIMLSDHLPVAVYTEKVHVTKYNCM